MTSKHILRFIDNLLEDISQNNVVFGSKHLVLIKIQDQIIQGNEVSYTSIVEIETDDPSEKNNFPIEFLNSLEQNELPPHKLSLKENSIGILLRNLNPNKG